MNIPFAKAYITDDEKNAVTEVLDSGWLTQGSKVQEFEEKFAKYVGAKYAIALNSCTSALFLSLKYVEPKKVLVPSLTFTASASVIRHNGATPVFGEINPLNYCLDVSQNVDEEIDTVVPVHLTGNEAPRYWGGKKVVEDSAHRIMRNTQGANPVCYSFYVTKNMTTGEGGMITTNDKQFYDWLKLARLHGSNKDGFSRYANKGSWQYSIEFCGYKMNMTDMNAAIGIKQLEKLDFFNTERLRIIDRYNKNLGLNNTGLHLYPVMVEDRDAFMHYMINRGVHCSVHFLALHNMPAYKDYRTDDLKLTELISDSIVSLPLFVQMTNEEVDYVSNLVNVWRKKQ